MSQKDNLRLQTTLLQILPKPIKLTNHISQKRQPPFLHLHHKLIHLPQKGSYTSIGRNYHLYLLKLKTLHLTILYYQQRKQTHQELALH